MKKNFLIIEIIKLKLINTSFENQMNPILSQFTQLQIVNNFFSFHLPQKKSDIEKILRSELSLYTKKFLSNNIFHFQTGLHFEADKNFKNSSMLIESS